MNEIMIWTRLVFGTVFSCIMKILYQYGPPVSITLLYTHYKSPPDFMEAPFFLLCILVWNSIKGQDD
jgi:hypothetical protein